VIISNNSMDTTGQSEKKITTFIFCRPVMQPELASAYLSSSCVGITEAEGLNIS